jgi:hypothetical protein
MLQTPDVIETATCAGVPVAFKWNEEISSKFAFEEELNVRMAEAFNEMSYRTNVTVAVCVFEWFVRRFDGILDLTDAYLRLEAAWASAINPHYLNEKKFRNYKYGDALPPPCDNVLTVGIARIWKPLKSYLGAEIGLSAECVNLALLTHYVMSDPSAFDKWLEAALRKGAASFPREVASYDYKADFYDFRVEKIVPREFFFDPDFHYSDVAAMEVLQRFLDTLNPEVNPYLHTADEMKAEGYARTPYKMLDLRKG